MNSFGAFIMAKNLKVYPSGLAKFSVGRFHHEKIDLLVSQGIEDDTKLVLTNACVPGNFDDVWCSANF